MIELEQIEFIRERANVTYAEAREALAKSGYNLVETLVYLEQQQKVKEYKAAGKGRSGALDTLERWMNMAGEYISKGNAIRFVISKKSVTAINLPLNIIILATIFMPPVIILGILAALFTNHKIKFERPPAAESKTAQPPSTLVSLEPEVKEAVVVEVK